MFAVCQPFCNTSACEWDAGDCITPKEALGWCGSGTFCHRGWIGDGTCDPECNTATCQYDGGDCIGRDVGQAPLCIACFGGEWNPLCAGVCGDGARNAREQCDDGNTADGDGCSSTCTIEANTQCSESLVGRSTCAFLPSPSSPPPVSPFPSPPSSLLSPPPPKYPPVLPGESLVETHVVIVEVTAVRYSPPC